MMDMRPANVDIVKRSGITISGEGHGARRPKRDKESDSRQEQAALRPITNMQMKKFADFRIMKKQKDNGDSHKNRQTKQPGPGKHDRAFSLSRRYLGRGPDSGSIYLMERRLQFDPVADWERELRGALCERNPRTTLGRQISVVIGQMLALPGRGGKQKADPSLRSG